MDGHYSEETFGMNLSIFREKEKYLVTSLFFSIVEMLMNGL